MTNQIQKAIKFAIKTHEVYQKQTRKGKDVSYISHPLTVGLLLAKAGANDNIIAAGILHDTIEDCSPDRPVTKQMILDRFGKKTLDIVYDLSEKNKSLSWEKRKELALEEIKKFSHNSLMVKSADLISNISEIISDYEKDGEKIFKRFNASKDQKKLSYLKAIQTIVTKWAKNPFNEDLTYLADQLLRLGGLSLISQYPSTKIDLKDYKEDLEIRCPICDWHGTIKEAGGAEADECCLSVSCPICQKMLVVAS